MPDVPEITIPASLRPLDGRFGSGPSKVRTAQVDALALDAPIYLGTSHRQAPVRRVVQEVRESIAALLSLPDGYEVLLGNGGTTTFWDAATFSLIEQRSEHLSFGEFSSKFAGVTRSAPHLADPLVVESEPGTHPDVVVDGSIDVYALTHNETSTGVMAPVARPRADGLVLVDATSGAAGLFVDPREFDCYYFAPQKSFAADGGLWLACCSPAAIERIEAIAASPRWVPPTLDLKIALDNARLQQTYNTPALATLHLLRSQLRWFLEQGGLAFSTARCERSAEILYGWAEASAFARPFVEKPAMRSRVVATIDLTDRIDALQVAAVLRRNGIVDTEPYRKLGRNQLRIALFPSIEPDDVAALCACIDWVVARLG